MSPDFFTVPHARGSLLIKTRVVGGRAVDRRHGGAEQAEIHSQLAAMMRKVAHGVADHDVPRSTGNDLARYQKSPWGIEVIFRGPLEGFARLAYGSFMRVEQGAAGGEHGR